MCSRYADLHFLTYSVTPCFLLFNRRVCNDEDQAFSLSNDLPPPSPRQQVVSLVQSSCVRGQVLWSRKYFFFGTAEPQFRIAAPRHLPPTAFFLIYLPSHLPLLPYFTQQCQYPSDSRRASLSHCSHGIISCLAS